MGSAPSNAESMRMPIRNAFVFVVALVPVMAAAQQFLPAPPGAPPDPNIRFEVVSLRAAEDVSGPMMMRMTPAGFEYSNLPIGVLLRQALQTPDYQIIGEPGWTNTDRYTNRAMAPEGAPLTSLTSLLSLAASRLLPLPQPLLPVRLPTHRASSSQCPLARQSALAALRPASWPSATSLPSPRRSCSRARHVREPLALPL